MAPLYRARARPLSRRKHVRHARARTPARHVWKSPCATSSTPTTPIGTPTDRPVPCWIPHDPVGDGLGRLRRPASTRLSLADKLRGLFSTMMLLGLGSAGGVGWLSIRKPAEGSD